MRTIAMAVALAAPLLSLLGPSAAQPGPTGAFRGFLTIVWGDPQPGRAGGGVLASLTYPDGTRIEVELAPGLKAAAGQLSGKRVVVRGDLVGTPSARRIRARSIEAESAKSRRPRP